ncbi:YkgJ family cysteine cluster protein [Mixta tenebrionis]|jgi:Fe-S-cluster containining protein|uniref:YkgJ family cysteine cluster protein n=2 Tax=Mixta TaxID=2100764 RepID=A0A6P1Q2H1_9GAMM|nr:MULTISPECIES: YkgJ family cysteine cluster protein [Mixta]QHM72621.1 hypothetical protein C7M51_02939 [Mixta intestinalis]TPW38362.1 YkgJ family cysteine cluster protein [Mixta tenebrionis]
MGNLEDWFYSACYNSFKVKSKRQVILAVERWHRCSERVMDEVKKEKGLNCVCQKGCSRCCSLHVSLITPDVFFIAENLKNNFSESKLFFIKKRLKLRADKVNEYTDDKYRIECVFLGKSSGQCVIYNYRPEACRRFFTNDKKDCIESNGSPLQNGAVFYSTGILSTYMALAAHKNNLFIDSHEMSKSLHIALDSPLLFKKWLRGEPNVFPGVTWERYQQGIRKLGAEMKVKIK